MPRNIFGDVSDPQARLDSRAWLTLPVSIGVHVVLLGAVLLVPFMAGDLLPTPQSILVFAAPAPLPPAPRAPAAPRSTADKPVATPTASAPAPVEASDGIAPETPSMNVSAGPGVVGGIELPSVSDGTGLGVPILPPPPLPPQVATSPLPIGGNIKPPIKVHHVPPVYPRLAQDARVEGTVVIEAIIGVDGRVKNARVLSSKPLLDQAALEAVRQWQFTPTRLNGVPVPVIMTVRVAFSLN